ncbi:MAG: hypothetical protein P1R58_00995 [bacterium]|nr:hypothetical protein [bacterium]
MGTIAVRCNRCKKYFKGSQRRFGEICGVDDCGGVLMYGGAASAVYDLVVCDKCGAKATHPPRISGEVCPKCFNGMLIGKSRW